MTTTANDRQAQPRSPEEVRELLTAADVTDEELRALAAAMLPAALREREPETVVEALARVMLEMEGVGRTEKSEQGYNYRGIEGVTAAAQRLLGRYGVVLSPRVLQRQVIQLTINNKPWTEDVAEIVYTVRGPSHGKVREMRVGTYDPATGVCTGVVTLDEVVDDSFEVGPLWALGRDNSDKGMNKCQPPGTLVRVPRFGRFDSGRTPTGFAEVPIETLSEGDRVVTWRRNLGQLLSGGRRVAGVASRPYEGLLVVATAGGASSRYTPDHLCVVAPGGQLDEGNHVVYLMERGGQFRVGRCLWTPTAGRTLGPIRRALMESADAVWLLSVHETAADAALAEAWAGLRFGLPDVSFTEGSRVRRYTMPLDEFWLKVGDNSRQADACLRSHGLLLASPLLRRPPAGSARWHAPSGVAAANLRSGMLLPVPADAESDARGWRRWPVRWTPVVVQQEFYSGPVYSLDVEGEHTYVADGIVTHNCMTQAFKYALLQILCIGDSASDSDREKAAERDAPAAPMDAGMQMRAGLMQRALTLLPESREALRAFCDEQSIPRLPSQMSDEQLEQVTEWLDKLPPEAFSGAQQAAEREGLAGPPPEQGESLAPPRGEPDAAERLGFDVRELPEGRSQEDDYKWLMKAPEQTVAEIAAQVKALPDDEIPGRLDELDLPKGGKIDQRRSRLAARMVRLRMEELAGVAPAAPAPAEAPAEGPQGDSGDAGDPEGPAAQEADAEGAAQGSLPES